MSKKKKKLLPYRYDLLSLIPKDATRILDVGCSDGTFGKGIKNLGKEVIGIELNPDACKQAQEKLDRVFLGDIENLSLPFPEGYFDCIIFADILEHLHNPENILKKYKSYLNDKGIIIGSIPNVRYYKLIIRLLRGTWDYMNSGILKSNGNVKVEH